MLTQRRVSHGLRFIASLGVAIVFVAPLIWLVLGSLQPTGQNTQVLPLIPNPISPSNYIHVFDVYDLLQPLLNSLFVVLIAVPLTIVTASGAGFALAQLSNRLRQRL